MLHNRNYINSFFLLLLFWIIGFDNYAQISTLDRIYQASQDTLAYDYNTGKKYLLSAILLSEEDGNDSITHQLYLEYGTLLWAHSAYDSARFYLNIVLDSSDNNLQLASALNTIGLSYFYQSEYSEAIDWLEKSLKEYTLVGDSSGISRVNNNLGLVHQAKGSFKQATEYIVEGLKYKVRYIGLADQYYSSTNPLKLHTNKAVSEDLTNQLILEIATTNDSLAKGRLYQKLGTTFLFQNQLDSGLFFIKKGYAIHKNIDASSRLGLDCIDLGDTYLKMGIYDSAEFYYQQSLDFLKKESMIPTLSSGLIKLADLYIQQQKYEQAFTVLLELLEISKTVGHKAMVAKTMGRIAKLKLQRKDIQSAITYGEKFLSLSKEIRTFTNEMDAHLLLTEIFQVNGQYKKALFHQGEYYTLNKKKSDAEIFQKAKEYEVKIALDRANSEILLLNEKQTGLNEKLTIQQNNLYLTSGLIFILLLLILYITRNNLTIKKLSRENKSRGDQNELLLSEVHHRVKNNLQMISSLLTLQIRRIDGEAKYILEETQQRIHSIALIHEQLYKSGEYEKIELVDLIGEMIQLINNTYELKSKPRISVEIEPKSLSIDQSTIIGLIIHELINNCYKYAFADHANPSLSIKTTNTTDGLRIELYDNGPGISNQLDEGFGWKIIRACLTSYDGEIKYQSQNGLHISISLKLQ